MNLSAEALAALGGIEHGARYNTAHTTARELIDAGLACDDWGHLGLTESGRVYLRRGRFNLAVDGDDIYDMGPHTMRIPPNLKIDRSPSKMWRNTHDDPMASPQHVGKKAEPLILEEAPSPPLPIAENRMQEMQRAAGVASGVVGEWPSAQWIEAFIRALDAPS